MGGDSSGLREGAGLDACCAAVQVVDTQTRIQTLPLGSPVKESPRMDASNFDDLLATLPACDRFPISDTPARGMGYVESSISNFIPTSLSPIEDGNGDGLTQVVIVSAPGAVGKSTLAREVARRKGALLLDLAEASEVAANSLQGALLNTLAKGNVEDFFEYLSEGLQCIVIDGLDEGRNKVNDNSFQRFLEDVARIAHDSEGTCFVLLGRTNIAEMSWLVLEEKGVSTSMFSIVPFDRRQAEEYVDSRFEEGARTKPFLECRDLIFENLAFSVAQEGHGGVAQAFLHYPPVLDVIVALLDEEKNFQQLKNLLSEPSASPTERSIELLQRVIARILEREQGKALPSIASALEEQAAKLQWREWDCLYSSDEQCKRLLSTVLGRRIPATPERLPLALHQYYEESEAITSGFPEHPFLQGVDNFANRVFESYLYARALLNDFGPEAKEAVTDTLVAQEHLPTRLLAAFYLVGGDSAGERQIAPEHVGLIYDSLVSDDSNTSLVRLAIDAAEGDGEEGLNTSMGEVEFESIRFDEHGEVVTPLPEPVVFSMPLGADATISFANQLRDATINVHSRVSLGTQGRDFVLGPDVQLTAGKLAMEAEAVVVKGRAKRMVGEADNEVVLESEEYESQGSYTRAPVVYEGSELNVPWPGSEQYPWSNYSFEKEEGATPAEGDLANVYLRFRRIMMTLRSHGRGALARTRFKVENRRVLQGEVGQKMLRQLEEDEILQLEDGRYFWNATKASAVLGVTWHDLRRGKVPSALADYLKEFVRRNQRLFEVST